MDLKSTVNLPKTEFAQKGNLPVREPARLEAWKSMGLYRRIREARAGAPRYMLHDGPPYANGNIHLGHVINKLLKDFVVRMRTMEGYDAPYIPGWDCHGLPIEKQVEKNLGVKKHEMSPLEFRRATRAYAEKYVAIQSQEFQRLGIEGEWDNPYLTMDFQYEADTVRALGKFLAEGSVFKGPRPVYWCVNDATALAEAEVEYQNHTSPSVYVAFKLLGDASVLHPRLAKQDVSVVIWTTTPWTLPANLAIAFHPEYDYAAVHGEDGRVFIVAMGMLDSVSEKLGWGSPTIAATFKGAQLEGMKARHPFIDRDSLCVLADYVTLDAGTGAVHTAPGHGHDDYLTGMKYGLDIYCPVDGDGRFDETVEHFAGQHVFKSNGPIVELLRERGALLGSEPLAHSYPHCWRCHNPLIYRATPQWFISMDRTNLRGRALEALDKVEWIPSWGRERMSGMIANRPDWCISRQRSWGVPITAFYCEGCDLALTTPAVIEFVAAVFDEEGADAWFARPASELMPVGTACDGCGGTEFRKETDILDVWIDSGASSIAVLKRRGLSWPADMYLEGNDQFRGWFNSSLMLGLECEGAPPYRTVLVHGMTVDEKGEKLSKSKGNGPDLDAVIRNSGVELLRLWVASVNYREEIPYSKDLFARISEAYRKIRNTARYALGNLQGFDPATDRVPYAEMEEIDRWALAELNVLVAEARQAYSDYAFHSVFHAIYNFCSVELSAIYFDVLKDRLYMHPPGSRSRRSAQTAVYEIIERLTRLLAPILAFTAEEIWEHVPGATARTASVHLALFPDVEPTWDDESLAERWEELLVAREVAQKSLEEKRAAKAIGSSLEAHVTLRVPAAQYELLYGARDLLEDVLIVSGLTVEATTGGAIEVEVRKSDGAKCERCWHYRETVGADAALPTICAPCVTQVREGWPDLAEVSS
ncbi:MAG: isoleucine--tRNA ligase [Blastocatellia bacterium]|nr:isoleucine--tRNA ligase [Blastocatellia bacterium]